MDVARSYTRSVSLGRERLLGTEWLLTDGRGGYAMGTALGIATRRYHALLVASLSPPVERLATLQSLIEEIALAADPGTSAGARTHDLSGCLFQGDTGPVEHPRGCDNLVRFEKDDGVRWVYHVGGGPDAGGAEIVRELALIPGENAARITWTVRTPRSATLTFRPLIAMRDHHRLARAQDADMRFHAERKGPRAVEIDRTPHLARTLLLASDAAEFADDPHWWNAFVLPVELARGYDDRQDLFSPGVFTARVPHGTSTVTLVAALLAGDAKADPDAWLRKRGAAPVGPGTIRVAAALAPLARAANDFVVARETRATDGRASRSTSVIAGYPWFSDWGRDSLISTPGLLLTTGRLDEALSLLSMFASHTRRGLIPNLFDDRTGEPDYNTVDASLWFIHTACAYLRAGGEPAAFRRDLMPACREVVDWYTRGTDWNIRVDPADGLVSAGDETTQLTWMDAKRDGVVFTPRHGKAVEINALWYHGLLSLAEATSAEDAAGAAALRARAATVGESFRRTFWNAERKLLFDLSPDRGAAARQIRPNQIFAASLGHSALTAEQRRAVVGCVRSRLLTPCGVRTLDPADPGYIGRYRGTMRERDKAYHNGTAWPWLLGPLAEAVLRVGEFSAESRSEARRLLAPIVARLDGECPGQLPEVFDGDDSPSEPQKPGGCPAQAWSVAEVLRVSAMIEG